MTPPVTLTPATLSPLKAELALFIMEHPEVRIRVGVKGGGCSGFLYQLFADTAPVTSRDFLYEQDGVPLVTDAISASYLKGTTLDYQKQGLQAGFVFLNESAKNTCGCGKSFS